MNQKPISVDEYINTFPNEVQDVLQKIRATIKTQAPQAIESISYGMPSYKANGKPLVYFGGFKKHIGLYATPAGHKKFAQELAPYKQGKGSVQFPIHKPIPYNLIARMVTFKLTENTLK